MLTQRLGSSTQKNQNYIDNVLKIIRENPGSCDEVWFASDYAYPPLEVHKETARSIEESMKKFKAAGIRTSLQISNTIGHGLRSAHYNFSGLIHDGSPVEYLVGDDGKVAVNCFCWRGKHFKKYITDTAKIYAELKPHTIWVDDDLRAISHASAARGCFCDSCIAEFNTQYKCSFTREELVHEINFGDIIWRERYTKFIQDGIYDFTYALSSAIHEISPETTVSFQHCHFNGFIGNSCNCVFDAMYNATGNIPGSRPGGGQYTDYSPSGFVEKGNLLCRQNRDLPAYVTDIRPEVENTPDVIYGKSIGGTSLETTIYFAMGATAMSYAMLMQDYEDFSWHGKMLASFAKHREYWKKLSDFNKKTHQSGISVFNPRDSWKAKNENAFDYYHMLKDYEAVLRYINIPIAYEDNDGVFILHEEIAKKLSREEMEYLISQPVLADSGAVDIFIKNGFDFNAEIHTISTRNLAEQFSGHIVNNGFSGKLWRKFPPSARYIAPKSDDVEAINTYFSPFHDENSGKISAGIIKTQKNAKWAVFAENIWSRTVSENRKDQLLNTIEYISGKPLSARLITPFQAVILPRTYNDGKLACVSILNCEVADACDIKIKVQNPSASKAIFISQYSDQTELEIADDNIITIPCIKAWSMGSLFFE